MFREVWLHLLTLLDSFNAKFSLLLAIIIDLPVFSLVAFALVADRSS